MPKSTLNVKMSSAARIFRRAGVICPSMCVSELRL